MDAANGLATRASSALSHRMAKSPLLSSGSGLSRKERRSRRAAYVAGKQSRSSEVEWANLGGAFLMLYMTEDIEDTRKPQAPGPNDADHKGSSADQSIQRCRPAS